MVLKLHIIFSQVSRILVVVMIAVLATGVMRAAYKDMTQLRERLSSVTEQSHNIDEMFEQTADAIVKNKTEYAWLCGEISNC